MAKVNKDLTDYISNQRQAISDSVGYFLDRLNEISPLGFTFSYPTYTGFHCYYNHDGIPTYLFYYQNVKIDNIRKQYHSQLVAGYADDSGNFFRDYLELEPNEDYFSINQNDNVDFLIEALKRYSTQTPNPPVRANQEYKHGLLLFKQGQLDAAKSFFENVIAIDKTFARAYWYIGKIFLIEGDFDKAIFYFTKAKETNPPKLDRYWNSKSSITGTSEPIPVMQRSENTHIPENELNADLAQAYRNKGDIVMAKKFEPSSDKPVPILNIVERRLLNLYSLQAILTDIDKLRTLRGELPIEVQDLEDSIEGLKTRIERFQAEICEIDDDITNHKNKISETKLLLDKYKNQLEQVRNNREFETLTKEIEFLELEVEFSVKKLKEANIAVSEKKDLIAVNKELLLERKCDLEYKTKELQEIISETRQEEERLREKTKAIEKTVEDRLLNAFKRIRKRARNGLAIVNIERDACGGCFYKLPQQNLLDIKLRTKIIVCDYCGRILVDFNSMPNLEQEEIETRQDLRSRQSRNSSERL
jgi:predicted  nucleic acid-binding Zn-ribbon protein